MTASALPLAPAMVQFLESPVAFQLAVASRELRPASTRGMGCQVEDDRRTLGLRLLAAQAERFVECLEVGRRVAANASHVVDFRGVQLKGELLEVRAADADESRAAESYVRALVGAMGRVGVPEQSFFGLWLPGPVVLLRVRVDALYEQTPGPGAGQKLEGTWPRL